MSNAVDAAIELTENEVDASRCSDEMYKAIIGPKNQEDYLRHFSRFDDKARISASWHWPAFFVTFAWLIYRKMWGFAAIYLFVRYVLAAQLIKLADMTGGIGGNILGLVWLLTYVGIFVLLPIFAHALYYIHCRKKITDSVASADDTQEQLKTLSKQGGTSHVALILGTLYTLGAVAATGFLISPSCGC